MRVIGVITTGVGAVTAVAATIVLIMSIPDIKRYLKIRSM